MAGIDLLSYLWVSGDVSEWLDSNRHEDHLTWAMWKFFSKVYLKLLGSVSRASGKRAVLVLGDFKSREWEKKMETLVWRVLSDI